MRHSLYFFILAPFLLLAQNEIPFTTFTVNADLCRGLRATTGSLIFIPDNAFVLENGSPCGEKVTIRYREFHSQMDMYYSRINMLWNDNGKYRILESVGMFEIEAWCGDKKLMLKEGKQIQVRMKTRRNLQGLWSYIYDRKSNTWSRYPSAVSDFSYFDKNNKSDSLNYWGSARQINSEGVLVVNPESDNVEGVWTPIDQKLPEGYFKGMNIKEMGTFNYDGVIKDSLAVPMVPEILVRNAGVVPPALLYVVYPNRNTLVYYSPSDFAERFVLLDLKGIRMFTEFKEGDLGITKDEEMEKYVIQGLRGKKVQFTVDRIPARKTEPKAVSAATGLNTQ